MCLDQTSVKMEHLPRFILKLHNDQSYVKGPSNWMMQINQCVIIQRIQLSSAL